MNFKEARESQKITQRKASEIFKVDRTTISKWESGISLPRAELLPIIASTYKCDISEVIKASASAKGVV